MTWHYDADFVYRKSYYFIKKATEFFIQEQRSTISES